MSAVAERVKTAIPTTTGGGGGNRLGGIQKKLGDGKGKYDSAAQEIDSGLGPQRHIVEGFKKHVGVKDMWNPGLISSRTASRADTYANQHVPKLVENAKTYFGGLKKAYTGDEQVKKHQAEAMIHAGQSLVNQRGHDMEVIKAQMDDEAAKIGQAWETQEHYLEKLGALDMFAIQTDRL